MSMMIKTALRVSEVALVFFIIEILIYKATQMPHALTRGGAAAIFVVFQFQVLMVLTASIGLFAPLAGWVEEKTQKRNLGTGSLVVLVGFVTLGFLTLTFFKLEKTKIPLRTTQELTRAAVETPGEISRSVKFTNSKLELLNPDSLKVDLEFQNLTRQELTSLEYAFAAVQNGHIFYRIMMRDEVYLPPQGKVTTTLKFERAAFKESKMFDIFKDALSKNELKVFAKPERARRIDGKVIEGQ